jgi:hypothetical protein
VDEQRVVAANQGDFDAGTLGHGAEQILDARQIQPRNHNADQFIFCREVLARQVN